MEAPVVVRRYPNDQAFAFDASLAAQNGYRVAAVVRESKFSAAGMFWLGLAILLLIGGLFFGLFLWLIAVVVGVIGLTGRRSELVVTYQRT